MNRSSASCVIFLFLVSLGTLSQAQDKRSPKPPEPGLLFYLSGDHGFNADYSAGGTAAPNFLQNVSIIPGGAKGPGFACDHKQLMSYWAPGNIYAERGTLSFFWRSREPVGKTEFPIFRVGYADHSSWDMVWLRIDYNGHGFDAFVTDLNLARVRVSSTLSPFPQPERWIHLALAWDETVGICFFVNGKQVARKDSAVVLYAGLDQFGPHSRVISPYQVQSAYNFQRGGDIDEVRIYDRMLSPEIVARLAKGESAGNLPPLRRNLQESRWKSEWRLRYGWNGDLPPYLDQPFTRVRKIEIQNAYDLKRWWWKGTDGIRGTTWPGVYNRSRLPGRNDYFQLPDWDCYSLSGKSITFFMPDEAWNHLEISGGAWGTMVLAASNGSKQSSDTRELFARSRGYEKTVHRLLTPVVGGQLQFTNKEQEMPIGELSAYNVEEGTEPQGIRTLRYWLHSGASAFDETQALVNYVNGRFLPDERTMMIALPGKELRPEQRASLEKHLPVVHIFVPHKSHSASSVDAGLDSSFAWDTINGGLDGIAIDLPAMNLKQTHDKLIPFNIQIKDPLWPGRAMLDFSFSVKPGEARTLWLDTRDRILPGAKDLYLTIASAAADFGPNALEGAQLRIVFKPWKEAQREHVQDRFSQVRDNYAFLVEEHPNNPRLNLYNRFEGDVKDLLRVDPKHYPGQNYWYDLDRTHAKPPFVQPAVPDGIPAWAFRQIEALRYFNRFVLWWIDNRQIQNGELGGGLSDDDDLTNCWPGAALMGCEPEKISNAVLRVLDAIYENQMFTGGLSTIQTDGLHAHEEGIEAQTQAMLVDYGSPKQVERMMETVRALDEKVILKNKAGHRHFRSSYFSGTKTADESVWEWSLQPHQFLLLQPVLTLAEFNGNLRARQLAIDVADGLLAHARKDSNGKIILDSEINFTSDSTRPSPLGTRGMLLSSIAGDGGTINTSSAALQLLWGVYRMTGEKKYLQPLLDLGAGVLGIICHDALDMLHLRETWGKEIAGNTTPTKGADLYRHLAWQVSGDKSYLEHYYADQAESSALREYINTEGSLWSDRVSAANRELQRSRLGGIALVRGAIHSGHVVSWKFKAPSTEQSVAILVPLATPDSINVIAYNLDQTPVEAVMTVWNIEPGTWELVQGLDVNGDELVDTTFSKRSITLERSKSVQLTLAPRETTILMLRLQSKSTPYSLRPDLGIGREDVAVEGNRVRVKVHSLGSVATSATTAVLIQDKKVIATVAVPAIPAPIDLTPKYVDVTIPLAPGTTADECSVLIDPGNMQNEITRSNNCVDLQKANVMKVVDVRSDQVTVLAKKPRAEHLAFNVSDPAAIATWYCENLGMKIVRKSAPPATTHFIADSAGTMMLELTRNEKGPIPDYASISHESLHLGFTIDDVNEVTARLLAVGAKLAADVVVTPSGDRILMLRDPWGLALQFTVRVSPMLKSGGLRFEHLALNVADPQSVANWYAEHLGMKVVRHAGPPSYTNFVADDEKHMMLELSTNAAAPILDLSKMSNVSLHFAFVVDDVRSIRTGLIAAGAALAEEIRQTNAGDQVLNLRDPWGFPIQFIKHAEMRR